MPEQFVVPQFIDSEDKIVGPISVRQFVLLLSAGLFDAILYKLLRLEWFIAIGVPLFLTAAIFAFFRVNGQPFHYFVLNLVQTFRKPLLRVWEKKFEDSEIRAFVKGEVEEVKVNVTPQKPPVSSSHLQDLTLIVNTGGVYKPEEE